MLATFSQSLLETLLILSRHHLLSEFALLSLPHDTPTPSHPLPDCHSLRVHAASTASARGTTPAGGGGRTTTGADCRRGCGTTCRQHRGCRSGRCGQGSVARQGQAPSANLASAALAMSGAHLALTCLTPALTCTRGPSIEMHDLLLTSQPVRRRAHSVIQGVQGDNGGYTRDILHRLFFKVPAPILPPSSPSFPFSQTKLPCSTASDRQIVAGQPLTPGSPHTVLTKKITHTLTIVHTCPHSTVTWMFCYLPSLGGP